VRAGRAPARVAARCLRLGLLPGGQRAGLVRGLPRLGRVAPPVVVLVDHPAQPDRVRRLRRVRGSRLYQPVDRQDPQRRADQPRHLHRRAVLPGRGAAADARTHRGHHPRSNGTRSLEHLNMAPPGFPPATPEGDSAVDHDGQPADNAAIAHARGGPSPPPDTSAPGTGASNPAKARTWRDKSAAAAARVKTGSVGAFWSRLTAIEFMNSALMFAGLFLVCFFPFLAVVDAAAGRNTQRTI